MNGTHPTREQLDRFRRRAASAEETIAVDAHLAACDRCFDAVRVDTPHLTVEQLEAVVDGRETHPHLALCAICRGEVADLRSMRDALKAHETPRWRWPLAAAAVLALVIAAAWLLFRREAVPAGSKPPVVRQTVPEPKAAPPLPQQAVTLERPAILDTLLTDRSVLRGPDASGAFALHAPVATVVLQERPRFRWAAVAGAATYEVTVVASEGGDVVASGTTTTPSWQPDRPLPRGRTYAWQVAAQTAAGRVVAPGRGAPEARFHVAAQAEAGGSSALERGIALARLGALDDAERELQRAGALELLAQVRGWRAQRALPTTTNGAQ
ncbi:MAG TPA: hypothetical protein VF618_02180 [Thermoanaerobaculia bacterium]